MTKMVLSLAIFEEEVGNYRKSHSLKKHLKATLNYQVKFIRCDNAGEIRKLEEESKNEGLGIIFEYTAPNTPQ